MLKINVKNYGSNIQISLKDGSNEWWSFNESSDDCFDFPYDINLESIIVYISDRLKRKLNDDEKELIEEEVSTWLSCHSCEDDDYYDAEYDDYYDAE